MYKKALIFFIITSLVFAPVHFSSQNRSLQQSSAYAIFGVIDTTFDPFNLAQMVWEWLRNNWVEVAREALKQRLLQELSSRALEFVRNSGVPRIVTDWNENLGGAFDLAFDSFMREINATEYCSNIPVSAFMNRFQQIKFANRPYRLDCTVDGFLREVGSSINSFTRNYASAGVSAPRNYARIMSSNNANPLYAYINQYSLLLTRSNQAAKDEEAEVLAGQGVKPTQYCYDADIEIEMESNSNWKDQCLEANGEIKTGTPGSITQDQLSLSLDSAREYLTNLQTKAEAVVPAIGTFIINSAVTRLLNAAEKGLISEFADDGGSGPIDCSALSEGVSVTCYAQQYSSSLKPGPADVGAFNRARKVVISTLNQAGGLYDSSINNFNRWQSCEQDYCNVSGANPCTGSLSVQNTLNIVERERERIVENRNILNSLSGAAIFAPGNISSLMRIYGQAQSAAHSGQIHANNASAGADNCAGGGGRSQPSQGAYNSEGGHATSLSVNITSPAGDPPLTHNMSSNPLIISWNIEDPSDAAVTTAECDIIVGGVALNGSTALVGSSGNWTDHPSVPIGTSVTYTLDCSDPETGDVGSNSVTVTML